MSSGLPIRVVMATDNMLFREGLRGLLGSEQGIEIAGETADGPETIDLVSELKPDTVLLDMTLPGADATEIIMQIKDKSPTTNLLLLPVARSENLIVRALQAGAKGYLSQGTTGSDLIKAIKAVHGGEAWVARLLNGPVFTGFGEHAADPSLEEPLSAREDEILRRLASGGGSNREIAESLFISEKTVKSHLHSIFRKLRVKRRQEAILYAIGQQQPHLPLR